MRLLEVVLAGVADVEDVRDLECLDNAGVRCVVPVSKIHTAWQNLVGVRVRHGANRSARREDLRAWHERCCGLVNALVLVVVSNVVEAVKDNVHFTATLLLHGCISKDTISDRQEVHLFLVIHELGEQVRQRSFVNEKMDLHE